jgi:hypothetical protein
MTTSRYWPFDPRWAFIASLVLVPILIGLSVWLFRPNGLLQTSLTFAPLLVAVLLGLVPILLVILGGVGSVEAAGVKVAFAAVQSVVSTQGIVSASSLIAGNMGSPPGQVFDTGSDNIIASLRDAVGADCVVADLKEGQEWWETRLLVLASGAARLGSPKTVVFTTATPNRRGALLGWATPGELLRRLIAMEPALSEAYQLAQHDWLLWQLGTRTEPNGPRLLPWAPSGPRADYLPEGSTLPEGAIRKENDWIEFPWPSTQPQVTPGVNHEDGFEAERFLLGRLAPLEISEKRRTLTEVRARELFASVLHTDAVDRDDDDEDIWLSTVLGSPSDFFAVTEGRKFVNLVPRRSALSAVLRTLASNSGGVGGKGALRI